MIVLRVIGIILLVILMLAVLLTAAVLLLPIRVELKRVMPDSAPKLRVGFGKIRRVFVLGKHREKSAKKTKKPKKTAKKSEDSKKQKKKEKQPVSREEVTDLLEQALPLVPDLIDDLSGAMTWERLHVTVIFHQEDAAQTGWQLSRWSVIVSNLYPLMERAFVLKDTKIVLDADFDAQHMVWGLDISVMTRLGRFVRIAWKRRKQLIPLIRRALRMI